MKVEERKTGKRRGRGVGVWQKMKETETDLKKENYRYLNVICSFTN